MGSKQQLLNSYLHYFRFQILHDASHFFITVVVTWRMSSDTETSDTWKPVLLPRLLLLVDLKSTHISPEPWRAHAQ